jgi:hypothetical protein
LLSFQIRAVLLSRRAVKQWLAAEDGAWNWGPYFDFQVQYPCVSTIKFGIIHRKSLNKNYVANDPLTSYIIVLTRNVKFID